MKKKLVIISMVALAMVACSKKNPVPNADNINADSIAADTIVPEITVCEFIPNAVKDYDGNTYNAVKIGEQVWMAENLRTTQGGTYGYYISLCDQDGVVGKRDWENRHRAAPDFKESNVAKYGYLYNWNALMNGSFPSSSNPSGVQGICPDGWHVPSVAEWTQLDDYMSKHNITGFSVPYAGSVGPGPGAYYSYDFGSGASLWSSTNGDGYDRNAIGICDVWKVWDGINPDSVWVKRRVWYESSYDSYYYSVRCVKD